MCAKERKWCDECARQRRVREGKKGRRRAPNLAKGEGVVTQLFFLGLNFCSWIISWIIRIFNSDDKTFVNCSVCPSNDSFSGVVVSGIGVSVGGGGGGVCHIGMTKRSISLFEVNSSGDCDDETSKLIFLKGAKVVGAVLTRDHWSWCSTWPVPGRIFRQ